MDYSIIKNRPNLFFVLSIIFILYFTLLPHPSLGIGNGSSIVKHEINLNPFAIIVSLFKDSFYYIVVNHIGNIILFMPLGYMLPLKWPQLTKQKIILIGCLASLSIELTQLLIPNRCTDIDDILLNTLGTWLGGARGALGTVLVATRFKQIKSRKNRPPGYTNKDCSK